MDEIVGNASGWVIREKESRYEIDLREKLLQFSIDTLKFLKTIPYRKEYEVLRDQLSRSVTSIGANYEEAQTATYNEFIQRIRIALREANETLYWLKIIQGLSIGESSQLTHLWANAKP
ncbi:four helix bundle protein [Lutibacter sp.]